MRDNQKSALYTSENSLRRVMDRALEFPTFNLWGSDLTVLNDRKFGDIHGVQTYVDRALGLGWVKSLWPDRVGYKVTVRPRKGVSAAHYESGGVIAVPDSKGGRWAMRELVILHELAHHLSPASEHHGEVFAGNFLKLIEEIISPENAFILRSFFHDNSVEFTLPE